MLQIKASCATSGDRSGRGTWSGLGKSAEQIRSNDESSDRPLPRRGQHYAAHGIVTETNSAKLVNRPIEPFRKVSLACRPGCSLAYFQPCRVRLGQFPGVPFEESSSRRQAKTLSLHCRCIDLGEQGLHVCLAWHCRSLSKVRDENSSICCRAAQQARGSIERNR